MSTPPEIRSVTVGRYGLVIPFVLLLAACGTEAPVAPEEPPVPTPPGIMMDCYDQGAGRLMPCPAD